MSITYRVRVYRNADFPASYPWRWTAGLEEWEDDDYGILVHEDGDSPEEALARLREADRRARDAPVDVHV
jgi:hypothetical protein